jgi:hypothetical protein
MATVKTEKQLSQRDANQVLQAVQNDVDDTLTVNGFLVGAVGRRIDFAITETNVPNDTQMVTFSENGIQLYIFALVFTDGSQTQLLYCMRTE